MWNNFFEKLNRIIYINIKDVRCGVREPKHEPNLTRCMFANPDPFLSLSFSVYDCESRPSVILSDSIAFQLAGKNYALFVIISIDEYGI